ncbi:hypothetical protein [Chitinophaga rhizosphaerae]|uniref:hypothetical protein n=1 Tax=Chitinophaga rhizosphaerae TaxID=1864947 RepID=UPI001F0C1D23|nr:hypothetical protein [Chitinophaga rhizosphaerae]
MSQMKIKPVNDETTARAFLQVHVTLNQDKEGWIQPLDKDIEDVFSPEKNKAFRFGEAIRWVMEDEQGRLTGRIAAFVNKRYKTIGDDFPVGGVGFFDCVDDQAAADLLFDTAKAWLAERGMEAMDGPINFGDRDRWWGLQVEGFVDPPFGMAYNPPYYKKLFENYGFLPFFNQICFGLDVQGTTLKSKFHSRHAAIAEDPAFEARHLRKDQLDKFAGDFVTVYNKAWAGHGGNKEMSREQAVLIFRKMKPVMDEEIVWFVYHNNEPVACWLNLPDLNQYFKHMHGKFGLLQKLQFLWLKMTGACRKFTGLVFGVVPEFQGKGVDSFMIVEGAKVIQPRKRYDQYEMQWVGDWNPKMLNVAESLGGTHSRKLTTFRYLFDRQREFKRHPVLQ